MLDTFENMIKLHDIMSEGLAILQWPSLSPSGWSLQSQSLVSTLRLLDK